MMNHESIDRIREPASDEFEKLEFLPEEPAGATSETNDSPEIFFTPESETTGEPPVSFSPADGPETPDQGIFDALGSLQPGVDAGTPFELFGTSLFGESELEDDIDALDLELLDDLEF